MRANYIPALILGAISFLFFRWLYLRCSSAAIRVVIVIIAFALAVPAILFASNYLLYIPYASWFVDLHAKPGAEISSGLVCALLGVMFASDKLRPSKLNGPVLIFCSIVAFILLTTPFIKQLYLAVDYSKLKNEWKDGICLQTSGHTCVPACAATMLKMMGGNITEAELAREAGTVKTGTEFWYLKRALRKYGYEPRYHHLKPVEKAPVPCILSVQMGSQGHVVVLLHKDKKSLVIGEPLRGRKKYDWKLFKRCYQPNGTYYTIERL